MVRADRTGAGEGEGSLHRERELGPGLCMRLTL